MAAHPGSLAAPPMSADDYLAIGGTEEYRSELVDGRVVVTASPTNFHQLVITRLLRLPDAARPDGYEILVELDWKLDEWNVRRPDLMLLTEEQAHRTRLDEPPLLVVEVLSPSTREVDLVTKRRQYAAGGAAHYWIVDIDAREVAVYRNVDGEFQTVLVAGEADTVRVDEPCSVEFEVADLLA